MRNDKVINNFLNKNITLQDRSFVEIIGISQTGSFKKFFLNLTAKFKILSTAEENELKPIALKHLIERIDFSPANKLLKQMKLGDLIKLDELDKDEETYITQTSGELSPNQVISMSALIPINFDISEKGYIESLSDFSGINLDNTQGNELKFYLNSYLNCAKKTFEASDANLTIELISQELTQPKIFPWRKQEMYREVTINGTFQQYSIFEQSTYSNFLNFLIVAEDNSGELSDDLISKITILANNNIMVYNATTEQIRRLNIKKYENISTGYYYITFDEQKSLSGLVSVHERTGYQKIEIKADVSGVGKIRIVPCELI